MPDVMLEAELLAAFSKLVDKRKNARGVEDYVLIQYKSIFL